VKATDAKYSPGSQICFSHLHNEDGIAQKYFDQIPSSWDGAAESLELHLIEIAANLLPHPETTVSSDS
jgi:hypothetical protein